MKCRGGRSPTKSQVGSAEAVRGRCRDQDQLCSRRATEVRDEREMATLALSDEGATRPTGAGIADAGLPRPSLNRVWKRRGWLQSLGHSHCLSGRLWRGRCAWTGLHASARAGLQTSKPHPNFRRAARNALAAPLPCRGPLQAVPERGCVGAVLALTYRYTCRWTSNGIAQNATRARAPFEEPRDAWHLLSSWEPTKSRFGASGSLNWETGAHLTFREDPPMGICVATNTTITLLATSREPARQPGRLRGDILRGSHDDRCCQRR
ncbi:hypothetical protein L1887_57096 [Cichorium endivia]|nr:hypothetical protein L1887_57096 [Cichorium endivia]